ncbi:MAG TPA: alpha-L-arabinofuranosidase C-terminal domain-containing protein [Niabella sp.]|nr:alpha-L-arabinofuranosidase C-terminal domain-containing protein [Niabella sp.]HQW16361.1 alpha-L-arabinofuranosidase C-terminal domain-containing protein [Niabella sp.]HQX21613.1 alpha-L-arabinofuranosidase C-terminal domain-containing protein [Niabella sp.]HRB07198.1 alpha-L-arabinofuranosidase C-terminal domain-containing protein [Niabella sp.]HRB37212.1 alpha-L-arabinofuranosidase C-terminal domain-containing protein [Niabella sp.]
MFYRFLFKVLLLTCFLGNMVVLDLRAQNARIKFDLDRTIGEVNKHIYGNFTEHLGRCIYEGIYDPGNKLSDSKGFRKDVMTAVKELNPTIIRYPGGNFVSNYNWLDGVGPKSDRIPRLELAWYTLETNQFGTNEFVEYAKAIGTEPYFSVNMGTGTIEEARRWVEYCNVKDGPYYAELRKKHGYPEPHNIKYWSLGNEMDGHWQMGHMNAEDYVKKAREAAKLMVRTSPEIKLIAAGSSNYREGADPDHWNYTILNGLKDVIDYIALHIYVGNPDTNYYNFISTPLVLEQRTKVVKGMIDQVMQTAHRNDKDPIYIAWDEYNVWYRARRGTAARGKNALEERYNLEDALVIAGFLNAFIRNADVVKMANMAQLVNVIAPIFTNETGMFKQTIFYPLQLFANNAYGTSLDVFVDCKKYNTEKFLLGLGETTTRQNNVPYLDVSATYKNGEVTLCVVNRNKEEAIETDIISQNGAFKGNLEVYEINGPDVKSMNDFGRTEVQTIKKPTIKADGTKLQYSFPPHSFTMIKGSVSR